MTLDFSALHLVIGNESPSVKELKLLFDIEEDNYSSSDTHYLITKSNISDEYFWIYARYGKSLPYSSTVYNTQKKKKATLEQQYKSNRINSFLVCILQNIRRYIFQTRRKNPYLKNI